MYFLSSCFVGAAAGILGLTNFAGFLFFSVSLFLLSLISEMEYRSSDYLLLFPVIDFHD